MKPTVYLSGGMKSGWQRRARSLDGFEWVSPDLSQLREPDHYTAWDLFGVRQADIVFAYMERDNPSGYGLALEVGYAAALSKTVIFIDGKPDPYLDIVRSAATVVVGDLDEGLKVLGAFAGE